MSYSMELIVSMISVHPYQILWNVMIEIIVHVVSINIPVLQRWIWEVNNMVLSRDYHYRRITVVNKHNRHTCKCMYR